LRSAALARRQAAAQVPGRCLTVCSLFGNDGQRPISCGNRSPGPFPSQGPREVSLLRPPHRRTHMASWRGDVRPSFGQAWSVWRRGCTLWASPALGTAAGGGSTCPTGKGLLPNRIGTRCTTSAAALRVRAWAPPTQHADAVRRDLCPRRPRSVFRQQYEPGDHRRALRRPYNFARPSRGAAPAPTPTISDLRRSLH